MTDMNGDGMQREHSRDTDPVLVDTARELKAAIQRLYDQLNPIEHEIRIRMDERGATVLDKAKLKKGAYTYPPKDRVRAFHFLIEGSIVPYERLVESGAYTPPQNLPGEWDVKELRKLAKEDSTIGNAIDSIKKEGRGSIVYDD